MATTIPSRNKIIVPQPVNSPIKSRTLVFARINTTIKDMIREITAHKREYISPPEVLFFFSQILLYFSIYKQSINFYTIVKILIDEVLNAWRADKEIKNG